MEGVPIAEAARRLGVSVDTVKRRLRNGELQGHKQPGRGGFSWLIELEGSSPSNNWGNASANATDASVNDGQVQVLHELVEVLKNEVGRLKGELEAKGREVQQLHVLLQQAQTALPAPRDGRTWWRL